MVDFVIFERIRAYDEVWVRQLLDKFAQAMGVTIDVNTYFSKLFGGYPDAFINGSSSLCLAESFDKRGCFGGYALFAKSMIGGTNTSVWQRAEMTTAYPPYTLTSESTIEGPDNMALLQDGGNSEVEMASIAPLEGSELKAAAEYLRRKYRIWKRINNRFMLFCTSSYDRYDRMIMMLFDRQRVDKLRKMVVHRRNDQGKMTDVTYYYMEPVLCEERDWYKSIDEIDASVNVATKSGVWNRYVEQLHDDKDSALLYKYRKRTRVVSRYVQEHDVDGMMVWLRVKL